MTANTFEWLNIGDTFSEHGWTYRKSDWNKATVLKTPDSVPANKTHLKEGTERVVALNMPVTV